MKCVIKINLTLTVFYRDPFKFVKGLFNQEKGGQLKATKSEVPHKRDVRPPRWKEVEEIVRRAKATSAPGPNEVPYWVYKSPPDILKFLWRQLRIVWENLFIPRAMA